MTALETIKKLILYAEYKRRLHDPEMFEAGSPTQNMAAVRRLKRELLAEGVDPQLLELSGDEIAQLLYEQMQRRE